jgi:hypothetical protein
LKLFTWETLMKYKPLISMLALAVGAAWSATALAVSISVPNGDFETAPPDPNVDGDNNYSTGDVSPPWNGDNNYLESTNEAFTRPSTFVAGWQSNGPADIDDGNPVDDGKFGLQQPRSGSGANQLYFQRSLPAGTFPTGTLVGGFNGNLIASVNMDDADGLDQEIQSVTIGNLIPGETYTLKVAVGVRAGQTSWNDVSYDIMLVANPVNGAGGVDNKFGSSGGTILGTPASITLNGLSAVPDGSNIKELTYTYLATTADLFAIRIAAHNAKTQNGAPDPGGAAVPANYRFTQGNFDNVRLTRTPEPAGFALVTTAALALGCVRRRRG